MAVIYEPLRTAGLMNASRHVFGMEGPCSAITLSLRRGGGGSSGGVTDAAS